MRQKVPFCVIIHPKFCQCIKFDRSISDTHFRCRYLIAGLKEPRTPTLLHIWPKLVIEINQEMKWTSVCNPRAEEKKRVSATPKQQTTTKLIIYKWCFCIHFRELVMCSGVWRRLTSKSGARSDSSLQRGRSVDRLVGRNDRFHSNSVRVVSIVRFTTSSLMPSQERKKKKRENNVCLFSEYMYSVHMLFAAYSSFILCLSLLLVWSFGLRQASYCPMYVILLSVYTIYFFSVLFFAHSATLLRKPPHSQTHIYRFIRNTVFCSVLFYKS